MQINRSAALRSRQVRVSASLVQAPSSGLEQEILLGRASLVQSLWRYFQAKFDPDLEGDRADAIRASSDACEAEIVQITDHDQDRVFQCPDFRGASNFGDDPATGYNYNTTYVGAEGRFPTLDSEGRLLEGWDHCRRGVPAAALLKECDVLRG